MEEFLYLTPTLVLHRRLRTHHRAVVAQLACVRANIFGVLSTGSLLDHSKTGKLAQSRLVATYFRRSEPKVNITAFLGNNRLSSNRAVGRCTLDLSTGLGLCTFSNGIGRLAGFTAEVNVSCLSGTLCTLDGTYKFSPKLER